MKSTSEVSVYAGRYQVSQTMDAPGLDSEADGAYILECLICHPHPPCVEPICPFPIAVGPPSQWRFKAPLLLVLIPSSDASTNVFQIFQIRVTVMIGLPPHPVSYQDVLSRQSPEAPPMIAGCL